MADMLLGPDGQRVLEKFHYGSATKNQPFKRWRPERGLTTEKYEKEVVYWEKLLKEVGRKIVQSDWGKYRTVFVSGEGT